MIILGIDPGTAATGYGAVCLRNRKFFHVEHGCIQTQKTKGAGLRLMALEKELTRIVRRLKPDVAAVERLFFFKNLKTALPVSEARGVILLVLAKNNIEVQEYTPLQAKMAVTGYGRADKKQMQRMVKEMLKLREIPKPDDAADALAMAIACASSQKSY